MFICAAGDIHGAMDRLYDDVLAFEESLGARFDCVLHVGDFGVWPDPDRVDKATRKHGGAGDFPIWFAENRSVPRPTVFIKGNHEDFVWLGEELEAGRREILPGLTYLPSGEVMYIGESHDRIRIGGIGGCYGPSNYERRSRDLQGWARRHFTHDECERLSSQGGVDVLLLHDAPAGVEFAWRRNDGSVRRRYRSDAEGLAQAVARSRPRVCFFGHHHTRLDAEIAGVRCVGLNKVAMPGNLVAVDIPAAEHGYEILGEWPRARSSGPKLMVTR
jgi:predicted phosphodiesterase